MLPQDYRDPQEHQDSQLLVVVVIVDNQAFQGRGGKREKQVLQDCLCQVLQDALGLLAPRVHKGFLDLQVSPQQDKTALLESLGVLVCREIGVIRERRARRVRDAQGVAMSEYDS